KAVIRVGLAENKVRLVADVASGTDTDRDPIRQNVIYNVGLRSSKCAQSESRTGTIYARGIEQRCPVHSVIAAGDRILEVIEREAGMVDVREHSDTCDR